MGNSTSLMSKQGIGQRAAMPAALDRGPDQDPTSRRDGVPSPSVSSDRIATIRSSLPPSGELLVHDTIPAPPPWHGSGEEGFEEMSALDLHLEPDA